MFYSKEGYVLIKNSILPFGYRINAKKANEFILFDDEVEVGKIIEDLLAQGVDIYENEHEFDKAYPAENLNFEEKRKQAIKIWASSVPEKFWSEEVKEIMKEHCHKDKE